MESERNAVAHDRDENREQSSVRQPAEQAVTRERRMTFRDAVALAARQIELNTFATVGGQRGADWALARDLCRVMAEVYMMRDGGQIKIGGELIDTYLVREVFRELRAEHVMTVIEALRQVRAEIGCKKAYMRSMLYNAVFEVACSEQQGIEAGVR